MKGCGRGEARRGQDVRCSVAIFILLAVVRLDGRSLEKTFNRNPAKRAGPSLSSSAPSPSFRSSPILVRPHFTSCNQEANAPSEHPSLTCAQPSVSYLFPLFHSDNLIFFSPLQPRLRQTTNEIREEHWTCVPTLFPLGVACRSCCSLICFDPSPF